MFPPAAGSDDQGNVHIPFNYAADGIPFARWQMVNEKIWDSPGPVYIQSVIITHRGEIFVTYAKEINTTEEYPKEGTKEFEMKQTGTPTITGESLVIRDEKRSYE
jgi:hypothetical protein